MRAAALQFDVTPDLEHNLDFVRDQLHVAAAAGIQLVVLPEMWASSFPSSKDGLAEQAARERQAVAVLRELSEELELCLAGSALVEEQGEFYNRLQVLDAGRELLRYDKVHLFSPTAEKEFFTAGSRPPDTVVSSAGRVSGAVCYDLRFPELFRVAHREGVEVFVLPAQWPQDRALHWRSLVIGRAIENQCFFIACNRTGRGEIGRRRMALEFPGNSLVVSPHGQVMAEGRGEQGLVSADLERDEVRKLRTRVPVTKDERMGLYREWLGSPESSDTSQG